MDLRWTLLSTTSDTLSYSTDAYQIISWSWQFPRVVMHLCPDDQESYYPLIPTGTAGTAGTAAQMNILKNSISFQKKGSQILILWISFDSRAICGDKKRLAPLLCFRAFSSNALHHYNYYQHHVIMFPWRKVEYFMNSLYYSPSILLSSIYPFPLSLSPFLFSQ